MGTDERRILITGAGGLVGSRIVEILSPRFKFIPMSRANGFDITNYGSYAQFSDTGADVLIHLAAKTDVDGCESEKELGENGEAWKINVEGTRNISDFCMQNNIKLLFFSTDFVFDGRKERGEWYDEEDTPNPINWYSVTKHEAEKIVINSGLEYIILRIAYPYRKDFEKKKDFARAILSRLREGIEVKAVTDHIMCPTYIDDVSYVVDKLIKENARGVFHSVGSEALSPLDAAVLVAKVFGLDKKLIKATSRKEYFNNKADRPFNLYLKNDKIDLLGLHMKTFEEGLRDINK